MLNPALVNVGDYVEYTDSANPAKTFKVTGEQYTGSLRTGFVLIDADGNESTSDLRQHGWVVVDAPLEDTVDGNLGEHDQFVVLVTYNDSEGEPGETLHGPFNAADAQEFANTYREDDTEIEDAVVLLLNPPEPVAEAGAWSVTYRGVLAVLEGGLTAEGYVDEADARQGAEQYRQENAEEEGFEPDEVEVQGPAPVAVKAPVAAFTREQLLEVLTRAASIGYGMDGKGASTRGDLTDALLTYPGILEFLPAEA